MTGAIRISDREAQRLRGTPGVEAFGTAEDFAGAAGGAADGAGEGDGDLDYAVRWRVGQEPAGRHASRFAGVGGHFRGYRPFWQLPDAARIDVRRSITDPFGDLMVRQTDDRAAISVILAADVSRSMRAGPGARNLRLVALLARAAARCAHRAGDRFGLLAFDAALRDDLALPPTRSRGAAAAAIMRLGTVSGAGGGSQGMGDLAARLPVQRALVLLASDFLMPIAQVETALDRLSRHDIAPVVFHEPRELAPPARGLFRLRDSETGQHRLLWLRPALLRRWAAAREARRRTLDAVFLRYGRPAFHVEGRLDLARLGEHLRAV